MHDWLALVANAACADKPDHIRHNAVNAVRMAAQSLVSLAHSKRSADAGWNILALRSGFMLFLVSDFFILQEEPHQWANRKSKSLICFFFEFWNPNCAQVDYGNQRCGKFDQVVQYMCQHRGNIGTIWPRLGSANGSKFLRGL